VERTELRRQAIELLTEQYFDTFGALSTDLQGYRRSRSRRPTRRAGTPASSSLNIVEEVREATRAAGTEVVQGDPWEVVLPTTLVALRQSPSLPSWTRQPDGSWTAQ
jgi:hypothetical protein